MKVLNLFISLFILMSFFSIDLAIADQQNNDWDNLSFAIQSQGKELKTDQGVYRIISRPVVVNSDQSKLLQTISSFGDYDSSHYYSIKHYECVWEKWTLNKDAIWEIYQWIFIVDNNGQLITAQDNFIQKNSAGNILQFTYLPTNEAINNSRWIAEKKDWTNFLNNPANTIQEKP